MFDLLVIIRVLWTGNAGKRNAKQCQLGSFSAAQRPRLPGLLQDSEVILGFQILLDF